MKKIIKNLFLAIAVFLLLLILFTRFCYQYILYPSPKNDGPIQTESSQILNFKNEYGQNVEVFYSPVQNPKKTIVYFHGNNETLNGIQYLAEKYNEYGFSIFMMEYPGYGDSGGAPSEENIYASANSVLDYLIDNGTTNDQVVIVGYSLGTGVATEMAYRGFGSSLVLIAPYTSITNIASRFVPFLPMGLLIPEHFDTALKAKTIAIPTLIVHGTADLTIPYAMGEGLSGIFENATLVTQKGKGHHDYFDDETVKLIADFL
ncbi:MAG: alpha/beta fold hydrolase [Candidatus Gracilibacteria bacterium]